MKQLHNDASLPSFQQQPELGTPIHWSSRCLLSFCEQ